MATPQNEKCQVSIFGRTFEDWETVWVRVALGVPPPELRVTVSEGVPLAPSWLAVRVRPGDECDVTMAGNQLFSGQIVERQVAYNAYQHGVMLRGLGKTQDMMNSSSYKPGTTGEYKDKKWDEIAREELRDFNIGIEYIGGNTGKLEVPFRKVQKNYGEKVYSFLERLARFRGATLGPSKNNSNNVAVYTEPVNTGVSLVEGQNILEANCQIIDLALNNPSVTAGQYPANDKDWGKKTQQQAYIEAVDYMKRWKPYLGIAERPPDSGAEDLKRRSEYEVAKRDTENITCEITVYGWEMSSGSLWWPGHDVHVKSPMLTLDQKLTINEAIFTQDGSGGTRTKLTLMKYGPGQFNVGQYLGY